jgi:hypothetical protein
MSTDIDRYPHDYFDSGVSQCAYYFIKGALLIMLSGVFGTGISLAHLFTSRYIRYMPSSSPSDSISSITSAVQLSGDENVTVTSAYSGSTGGGVAAAPDSSPAAAWMEAACVHVIAAVAG